MSGKPKRASRWVASPNSAAGVIARVRKAAKEAKPMPDENQTNVLLAYHQALLAMTNGYASPYHLDTVIYALNTGVILAGYGLGAEDLDLIATALDGVRRAQIRYQSTGKLGLDGDALVACRAAYVAHERQVKQATLGQLRSAVDEMYQRVEAQKEAV